MGYYTNYTLTAENKDGNMVDVEKINNFLDNCYNIEASNIPEWIIEEVTWHKHEEHLLELSGLCGDNTLFYLHGEGENNLDVWDEYYRNGKMVRYVPQVIYPEFNETDLQ
jgi:hypothetical protein